MKNIVLLLLAIICPAFASFAGDKGTISGAVTDKKTFAPLQGARVYILGTTLTDTTDIYGIFSIKSIPVGICTLLVTKSDYENGSVHINTKNKFISLVSGDYKSETKSHQMNIYINNIIFPGRSFTNKYTGSIKGTIRDRDTYERISGGSVDLIGTKIRTNIDENGEYVLAYVPIGTYTVRVDKEQYETNTIVGIKVIMGLVTKYNFKLHQSKNIQYYDGADRIQRYPVDPSQTQSIKTTRENELKGVSPAQKEKELKQMPGN